MKFNWKKHLLGYIAVAMVCVMVGSAVTLTSQPVAVAEETTVVVTSPFTAAIAQVRDSVVGVSNYQEVRYSNRNSLEDFFGYGFGYGYGYGNGSGRTQDTVQEVLAGTGSGVVVGKGYVLTNHHVIEDNSRLEITVMRDGAEEADVYPAAVVAYDENLDVAVVYAPDLPLEPVALGDSDTLQVGDWAICIGNPLGEEFSGTVTTGIVSALNRAVSSTNYDKYGRKETVTNAMIQTDAAINSGNSGGGMFSVTGELMGIPTLKYTGSAYSGTTIEGIGMCIPINAAKPLIEEVLTSQLTAEVKGGETAAAESTGDLTGKPRMGISVNDMESIFRSSVFTQGLLPKGVYVVEVEEGGPAAAAGMKAGDVIVDVNDTVITSFDQMSEIITAHKAGDTLKVKVYRAEGLDDLENLKQIPEDGEYVDLEVTLAVVETDVKQ
ncbi:MAG: trypsin-like peptidase domain-containing protein [Clostridia bacterium]|nr:trypsin-like peptidase domain-containing protein [Clostridia bacterium]